MEAISRASASEPDCARYQIFGTLPSDAVARSSRESAADPDDAASIAEALEATRAACMSHLEPHVEGYIWQKDPFQLEVVAATPPGTSRSGAPAHLAGVTRFGDNVEDEWFIVGLLLQITTEQPDVSIAVADGDGELLLIEGQAWYRERDLVRAQAALFKAAKLSTRSAHASAGFPCLHATVRLRLSSHAAWATGAASDTKSRQPAENCIAVSKK